MPIPTPDEARNMIGKNVRVPAGIKGECKNPRCRMVSQTDGSEVAMAHENELFNGKFYRSGGFLAFTLPCPSCERLVQFVSDIRL